jgi:type I site-specific restriction endonuclease
MKEKLNSSPGMGNNEYLMMMNMMSNINENVAYIRTKQDATDMTLNNFMKDVSLDIQNQHQIFGAKFDIIGTKLDTAISEQKSDTKNIRDEIAEIKKVLPQSTMDYDTLKEMSEIHKENKDLAKEIKKDLKVNFIKKMAYGVFYFFCAGCGVIFIKPICDKLGIDVSKFFP